MVYERFTIFINPLDGPVCSAYQATETEDIDHGWPLPG
jgi:hypothetical protein